MKNYMNKKIETKTSNELRAAHAVNYMTQAKNLITFNPESEVIDVINALLKHRISGCPVLNDYGEVVGLIDDKDCLNIVLDSVYHNQPVSVNTVKNYMTNVFKTVKQDADLVDVTNIFMRTNFKRLIVVDDDGKLVGQISRRDVLRAVQEMNSSTW